MTRVIVTGATGMIGSLVLDACLARGDVSSVTSILRRPSGRSKVLFAQAKGVAEEDLMARDLRLHIFRPGYIYPVTPRREPNLFYRLFRVVYPAVSKLAPNIGIRSEDLARAMMRVGFDGCDKTVLENSEIRALTYPAFLTKGRCIGALDR